MSSNSTVSNAEVERVIIASAVGILSAIVCALIIIYEAVRRRRKMESKDEEMRSAAVGSSARKCLPSRCGTTADAAGSGALLASSRLPKPSHDSATAHGAGATTTPQRPGALSREKSWYERKMEQREAPSSRPGLAREQSWYGRKLEGSASRAALPVPPSSASHAATTPEPAQAAVGTPAAAAAAEAELAELKARLHAAEIAAMAASAKAVSDSAAATPSAAAAPNSRATPCAAATPKIAAEQPTASPQLSEWQRRCERSFERKASSSGLTRLVSEPSEGSLPSALPAPGLAEEGGPAGMNAAAGATTTTTESPPLSSAVTPKPGFARQKSWYEASVEKKAGSAKKLSSRLPPPSPLPPPSLPPGFSAGAAATSPQLPAQPLGADTLAAAAAAATTPGSSVVALAEPAACPATCEVSPPGVTRPGGFVREKSWKEVSMEVSMERAAKTAQERAARSAQPPRRSSGAPLAAADGSLPSGAPAPGTSEAPSGPGLSRQVSWYERSMERKASSGALPASAGGAAAAATPQRRGPLLREKSWYERSVERQASSASSTARPQQASTTPSAKPACGSQSGSSQPNRKPSIPSQPAVASAPAATTPAVTDTLAVAAPADESVRRAAAVESFAPSPTELESIACVAGVRATPSVAAAISVAAASHEAAGLPPVVVEKRATAAAATHEGYSNPHFKYTPPFPASADSTRTPAGIHQQSSPGTGPTDAQAATAPMVPKRSTPQTNGSASSGKPRLARRSPGPRSSATVATLCQI